ncbi:conserved hypothetical protein [Trichinella spiralis]|uniref:hypothetical protein n=1 Tax=Trichinella spiralis TaxID=6334 RepID=UPI0001EFEBD8|nr:conserved hypothetical protein [Trichinella spiralis]
MPAHEEEGGVLGPHLIGKRDRYGLKQNLCRAGVANTDLRFGVATVPGVGVVLPQVRRRFCDRRRLATPSVEKGAEWDWSKTCQLISRARCRYYGRARPIHHREVKELKA